MISDILRGGLLGIVATVIGWLKSKEVKKFRFKGLLVKIPAGFVIGVTANMLGQEMSEAHELLIGLGAVELLDQLTKVVLRRLFNIEFNLDTPIVAFLDEDAANALEACVLGTGSVADVIKATEAFREILKENLNTSNPLDKEFFEHASYVFNQVLQILRRQGLTKEALEGCGKLIYRFYIVWKQYSAASTEYTATEWLSEFEVIMEEVEDTFNGIKEACLSSTSGE